MPAIDPMKLKRLMATNLLIPYAMKRRLSPTQLSDLVRRAIADKKFDLSATSDEFADYHLDEAEAAEWADELDRSGKAPHLFTPDPRFQPKPEEKYGGYTAEQFEAMSPQEQLSVVNRVEYERAKRKH
jgi:hypothetical protein